VARWVLGGAGGLVLARGGVFAARRADARSDRDAARDAQYTRELGAVLCDSFKRDTVLMSTHVVAAAAFERLRRSVGGGERLDVFALLRHRDDVSVPRGEFVSDVASLLDRVRDRAKKGDLVLAPRLEHADANEVVDEALRAFAGYHSSEVLVARGPSIVLADTRLLLYYQNRLAAHGLAVDVIAPRGAERPGLVA
jgi:glycerol-3-phosphate O-acyltransferase